MTLAVACPTVLPPEAVKGWRYWSHRPHLVVDNTTGALWRDLADAEGWAWIGEGRNLGVAAAWNTAFRWADAHGYGFVGLVSQSYEPEGGTASLAEALAAHGDWRGLLNSSVGFHGCVWSVRLWREVGGFDERFWPAYYEDTDWLRRLDLLGFHSADNPMRRAEVPGRCPHAVAFRAGVMTEADYARCGVAYAAKWGGPPGAETVTDPAGAQVAVGS